MSGEKKDFSIDISSKMLESGVDIAKSFVDKLVIPPIEELGLLVRDQISYWRFSNQVKILNKAKFICEKNNVSVKAISPKLLCPYLENASLEDDEDLQNKWAILLVNMADSKQNIQNQVFPYILNQLSKEEFNLLESVYMEKRSRVVKINNEIKIFLDERNYLETKYGAEIDELKVRLSKLKSSSGLGYSSDSVRIGSLIRDVQVKLKSLGYREESLKRKISLPQKINDKKIKEFELANIVRLGLAKVVYEASAGTHKIEIPISERDDYVYVDLDIDVDTDASTILTELGEMFIEACQEKCS